MIDVTFYDTRTIPQFTRRIVAVTISYILKKMLEEAAEDAEIDTNDSKLSFSTPEKQEARAFLRERFLRVITGIVGKKAEFYLHENSRVTGEFRGTDVDCLEVFVRNLETPMGKIPEAILRTSDIIHMNINNIKTNQ